MSSPATGAFERASKIVHSVVVVDGGTVVLDETFDTPAARRTAVVDLMLQNHDEVAEQDVVEILASFGGADADTALALVINEYASIGVDVTVHLGIRTQDVGPARLFTVLIDYGDGAITTAHYPTREARLAELRSRAAEATVNDPGRLFTDAGEQACRMAIQEHGRRGRVYLVDAARLEASEVFVGRTGV